MNPEIIAATYPEELYQLNGPLTVMINKPWPAVTPEEITLLSKILASVGQSLDSVRIIHSSELSAFPMTSKMISFGLPGFPEIELYQVTHLNGHSIVKSDLLSELDDPKKKNLWLALRQMFEML